MTRRHNLLSTRMQVEIHDVGAIDQPSQISPWHILTFHNRFGGPTEIAEDGVYRRYEISEGTFCLAGAGRLAPARWSSPRQLTFIAFDTQWWDGVSQRGFGRVIHPERHINANDRQIGYLVGALLAELEGHSPSGEAFTNQLAETMVLRLCAAFGSASAKSGGLTGWRINQVIRHIESNLSRALSIHELASLADLHPDHFARAFRQATGLPPHRYLVQTRIRVAKERLGQGTVRMADLAQELGFADQSHFHNVFRRETGSTPAQFRATLNVGFTQRPPFFSKPEYGLTP